MAYKIKVNIANLFLGNERIINLGHKVLAQTRLSNKEKFLKEVIRALDKIAEREGREATQRAYVEILQLLELPVEYIERFNKVTSTITSLEGLNKALRIAVGDVEKRYGEKEMRNLFKEEDWTVVMREISILRAGTDEGLFNSAIYHIKEILKGNEKDWNSLIWRKIVSNVLSDYEITKYRVEVLDLLRKIKTQRLRTSDLDTFISFIDVVGDVEDKIKFLGLTISILSYIRDPTYENYVLLVLPSLYLTRKAAEVKEEDFFYSLNKIIDELNKAYNERIKKGKKLKDKEVLEIINKVSQEKVKSPNSTMILPTVK